MAKDKANVPMCWKCASKITEPNEDGKSSSLVGCKEEPLIKDFSDAEKLCPLIKQKILITVNGGVVSVDDLPKNVVVEVRDYDVEGMWDEDNESCKEDSDGDRYQEMIFLSTE
jgi:hypothetical protein